MNCLLGTVVKFVHVAYEDILSVLPGLTPDIFPDWRLGVFLPCPAQLLVVFPHEFVSVVFILAGEMF